MNSDSPFRIEWSVTTANPFLASLQSYARENKQHMKFKARPSTVIPVTKMIAQEIVDALQGNLIIPCEEKCQVVCRLTSNSVQRDILITKVDIQLNPDFKSFI